MAYRAYRSDRGFRRRRWLLILVSFVAIISVIAFLVSRQTEQRGAVEFFEFATVVNHRVPAGRLAAIGHSLHRGSENQAGLQR